MRYNYFKQDDIYESIESLNEIRDKWDEKTCANAAFNSSLECLKYLHENGSEVGIGDPCPWNEDTCVGAAMDNSLECLQYAHENGCPWDEDTCSNAVRSKSIECLKYAH